MGNPFFVIFTYVINEVYTLVKALLNKSNFGYLPPADFNLLAQNAQLEEFFKLFEDHNNLVNMANAGMLNSGHSDMLKVIAEEIDNFTTTSTLAQVSGNTFTIPSDAYMLNKILRNDSGADYTNREMERVEQSKITMLENSDLVSPTEEYPCYTMAGTVLTAYPTTLNQAGDVVAVYVRFPLAPKWTFSTLANGEAVFNQSQGDYQDFELSEDHFPMLTYRILKQAGLEIREQEVVQYAMGEKLMEAGVKQQ